MRLAVLHVVLTGSNMSRNQHIFHCDRLEKQDMTTNRCNNELAKNQTTAKKTNVKFEINLKLSHFKTLLWNDLFINDQTASVTLNSFTSQFGLTSSP